MYNFFAGPAGLPAPVLRRAQQELTDYAGTGMSVMELSHRSPWFEEILHRAGAALRRLMQIPPAYHVLFLQGGATTQFSAVPLNLLHRGAAAYLDTGVWASKAAEEAARFGPVRILASGKASGYREIPDFGALAVPQDLGYLHLTTNNTIYGTALHALPRAGSVPLAADMSSDILSRPYRVEDFGLIYAGAQKNIGPSGLTVVIVREDLIGRAQPHTPLMLDYAVHARAGSMHNTPPAFAIYMAGLVFEWLEAQGGVAAIDRINEAKAQLLYAFLDSSSLFRPHVQPPHRSRMNVAFGLADPALEARCLREAEAAGFQGLAGHRSAGGLRASLYNAVPIEAVQALADFLRDFEQRTVTSA
ncbi:MAG: 3-phosphoserine/phosphohydroxythreonine transaminase [Bacteroidia bacterium]|nr:3-phosphoserine/phosphohydroxythreonine transaminase [Bacteroidia bacterium]